MSLSTLRSILPSSDLELFIRIKPALVTALAFIALSATAGELQTDALTIHIENGKLLSLEASTSKINYLPEGVDAPVLQLRVDGKFLVPNRMEWREAISDAVIFRR